MDREAVVNDFLALYMQDLAQGEPRPLEEYQARFPGHEDLIAAEHTRLHEPAPESIAQPPSEAQIGPYRILGELGKGGMGTVFLAEQTEPVHRQVALKVIKPGMDSSEVLRRFEVERQTLAMMEHDSIARVLDAGTTERGRPYFVMEHVPGLPLTDYCDRNRLRTTQRLELFLQICAGIQHAHQRGVIHRDLKPSNILVIDDHGRHIPKIIDFGVAKAMEHGLTAATMFTRHGQLIGTPEYMSPEQAEMTSADIDTRADVYSLGVILYELLVGTTPLSSAELRSASLSEVQRRIREEEPDKPSTRLSGLGEDALETAHHRQTTPATLGREIRGDLDWIVMMAMDKDRNRRYGSPGELAADIRRHLEREPVSAGPPTARYRLSRLLRRYRGQVAAAAAVFLALLAGTVLFALENRRAHANELRALQTAEEARRDADRARRASDNEGAARQVVAANLERFNLLADVVKLEDLQAAREDLYPAWPENADRTRSWIARAEDLAGEIPSLERALDELHARSRAQTDAETESARRQHPRYQQLLHLQSRLDAARRALDVREGRAVPAAFELADDVPDDPIRLHILARQLVVPERSVFGREAEGLALARRAWNTTAPGDVLARPMIGETLAWALFANGLDDAGAEAFRQVLEEAPDWSRQRYESAFARFRMEAEAATGPRRREEIERFAEDVARMEAEVSRPHLVFDDDADGFLHDTLEELLAGIRSFADDERGALATARQDLTWAESLSERSVVRAQERWQAATEAIRRADGVVASELYRTSPPIQLSPQLGLVPIGMNPHTGLWEFYHLRSAADPDAIPEHAPDGSIDMTGETGIVFVLLPGGTVTLGAQRDDPGQPNYDPMIDPDESLRERTISPYFMARHELTQGQWQRLSFGDNPSQYHAGTTVQGVTVTRAHPVEQVSFTASDRLLRRYGLLIPTESQWEYACRATSGTPWSTGAEPSSLVGFANLLDRTAVRLQPNWGLADDLEDGFVIHAPVGTFLPNAFGIFDMHGNLWEWCVTDPDQPWQSVQRGASYFKRARFARSSNRLTEAPGVRANDTGIRPVREIH